jgi:hypothetical protein
MSRKKTLVGWVRLTRRKAITPRPRPEVTEERWANVIVRQGRHGSVFLPAAGACKLSIAWGRERRGARAHRRGGKKRGLTRQL